MIPVTEGCLPSSNDAVRSIVRGIASTAQAYLDNSESPSPAAQSNPPRYTASQPSTVNFPDPPNLLPILLASGAQPDLASHINVIFRSRVYDFKVHCETSVTEACSRVSSVSNSYDEQSINLLKEKITSAFRGLYDQALQSWTEKALWMLKNRSRESSSRDCPTKVTRQFNHEYIPLLEHFFNENPFPSHADKAFLAKKSGMTYRQIHVWFQNHRSRVKKENRPLRRKPLYEGATLPLDGLLRRMGKYAKDPEQPPENIPPTRARQNYPTPSSTNPTARTTDRILDNHTPGHAFPASYPPTCSYNPFPQDYSLLMPQRSHWPRQLYSPSPRQSPIEVDSVEGMIEKFAQMNLRDEFCVRPRKRPGSDMHRSPAATFAITVRPYAAPHPALVRSPARPKQHIPPLPVIPARSSQSTHVFKTPGPQSPPITLVPLGKPTTPPWHVSANRKYAPLPRRVRISQQNICRSITPAVSDTSVSSPSVSRLSSYDSDDFSVYATSDSPSTSSPPIVTESLPTLQPTPVRQVSVSRVSDLPVNQQREYQSPSWSLSSIYLVPNSLADYTGSRARST